MSEGSVVFFSSFFNVSFIFCAPFAINSLVFFFRVPVKSQVANAAPLAIPSPIAIFRVVFMKYVTKDQIKMFRF